MVPLPVTVIRSPRENLAKCSLRTLEARPEFRFLVADGAFRFDATGFLLLELEAPALAPSDRGIPLLILDSTWHLLPALAARIDGTPVRRALPGGVKTSYPRASKLFRDPPRGLASIEAVFLAKAVLGEWDPSLLAGYYWKDEFLASVTSAGWRPGAGAAAAADQPHERDRLR
ncbi:MAG: hypothetical protein L0Z55_01800 [Planctomycetes bacterium]|nr:hypothetical protein [Planctomycetota bacterium]